MEFNNMKMQNLRSKLSFDTPQYNERKQVHQQHWSSNANLIQQQRTSQSFINDKQSSSKRPSLLTEAETFDDKIEYQSFYNKCCLCCNALLQIPPYNGSSAMFNVNPDTPTIPTSAANRDHDHKPVSMSRLWLKRLGKILIGFLISAMVCATLTFTTYFMRKIINDFNNNLTVFTIDTDLSKTPSCNNCLLLAWLATLFLILAYPIYFFGFIFIYKRLKINDSDKLHTPMELFKSSFNIFTKDTKIIIDEISTFAIVRGFVLKVTGLTLLWLMIIYTYLRAIDTIDISEVIMIFSIGFAFEYMASWILLHKKFIPAKLLAIILSIACIVLIVYADGFTFDSKFLGNACAGLSAACTTMFKIFMRVMFHKKTNAQRTLLFSLIALFNFFLCWPFLLLFHFTKIEFINLSSINIGITGGYIIGACLLTIAYIILLEYSTLVTYRIFVHLGGFLTIFAALFIDLHYNGVVLDDLKIAAVCCITIAYLFLMVPNDMYIYIKSIFCHSQIDDSETNSLTRKYRLNN